MGQGNPSTFQILRLLQGALDQGIPLLPQVQFHRLHLCQALGGGEAEGSVQPKDLSVGTQHQAQCPGKPQKPP